MIAVVIIFFVFYLWFLIGKEIINYIEQICRIFYWMTLLGYKYFFVERPFLNSEYYKNKVVSEEMTEVKKEQDYQDRILNKQNKIDQAAINNIYELRVRYPYANENLFKNFLNKFSNAYIDDIKKLENEIRISHLKNEINYSIDVRQSRIYTINDLNGLTPLEINQQDNLILKIFRIDYYYLLYIKNVNNESKILQSKDYLVVARLAAKILEEQRKLKQQKMIEFEQVNDLFTIISESVTNYRKNNMNFLE